MEAIKTQATEIWTGAVAQLPRNRETLEPCLFVSPELTVNHETGLVVLEIFGLIDQPRWLRIAVAINEVVKARATGLVVRLSSRAQVALGCGVAFVAMEDASRVMSTTVHIEGTGALGAAIAFASFAKCVVVDSADLPVVGGLVAMVCYGSATKKTKLLARDIQLTLRCLAPRDRVRGYAETVAAMVNAERIAQPRAANVLKHLNFVGTANQ